MPLDNNPSERALRRIALGRKNDLFEGDVAAGKNLAGLSSLAATCESGGINPLDEHADVLSRLQDYPRERARRAVARRLGDRALIAQDGVGRAQRGFGLGFTRAATSAGKSFSNSATIALSFPRNTRV